jgi:hypothetical protein
VRRSVQLVLLVSAVIAIGASAGIAATGGSAEASFLQKQLPIGGDAAGRHWFLGGFSALAPIGASGKDYWTVSDRGPNDDADRALADGSGVFAPTSRAGS